MSAETVCPLCDRPRPRGANRCRCNYTFEYGPPMRLSASGGSLRPDRAGLGQAPIVATAVIAAAIAYFFGTGIDHAHAAPGTPVAWVLVAIGLFTVCGALFDWSWFMGNRRARLFVALFGRGGARVVYGLIGGAMLGFAAGLFGHVA